MEQIYRVLVSKQIEYSVEVEADSPQEAMELIEKAKKDGFEYEWEKYTDIEYPA